MFVQEALRKSLKFLSFVSVQCKCHISSMALQQEV